VHGASSRRSSDGWTRAGAPSWCTLAEARLTSLVAVVEDDESLRLSIRNLLASAGFAVAPFPSAEALLSSPEFARVSCLVLDLQLDGMGGLELVARLAADGRLLPFVVLTALDDPEWERESRRAGAFDFLRKPSAPDELLRAVDSMLAAPR
jgi:FixJ family two-component response regulator